MSRPYKVPKTSHGPPWWLIVLIVVLIVGGIAWWQSGGRLFDTFVPEISKRDRANVPRSPADDKERQSESRGERGDASGSIGGVEQSPPSETVEERPPAETPTDVMPPARYPIPGGMADDSQVDPTENVDEPILQALTGLAPRNVLGQFLNLQDFVRRFVVTVDNLPREIVPSQLSAVRRTPGPLAVRGTGESVTLSAENFARYEPVIRFLETIDPRKAVAAYAHFYPLLQYEYRQMGFPKQHFSDRVIDAIDNMLSAPKVDGPIELVQPKVLYKFADPVLEKLSAGRKIMIRIGPQNAERLKVVLRGWRAVLVGKAN